MKKQTFLRKLCLGMLPAMALSMAMTSTVFADAKTFPDVAEGSWYYTPVEWAIKNNITAGTSETTFSPHDNLTRAQMVTLLWRAEGAPESEAAAPFTDMTSNWYKTAVSWATENKIVSGKTDTTFDPNGVCTRAQAVSMLWRAAASADVDTEKSFKDVAETKYYADAVDWAVSQNVTSGTSKDLFSPDKACNRAEAVAFLSKTFRDYSLVQNVYNWGSSYSKVIVKGEDTAPTNYSVNVQRKKDDGTDAGSGVREITTAYRSDEKGNENANGNYVTLAMSVSSSDKVAQPYYNNGTGLKSWADITYTVVDKKAGSIWGVEETVFHPDEEKFKTDTFKGETENIPYAYYESKNDGDRPLVVWLHGFGSGGTDIGFVTGGMRVTNFVSDDVQNIFDGADILLPQARTMWRDGSGKMEYSQDGYNVYEKDLKALIDDYVAKHDINTKRIYIGGCSSGGYMTVDMVKAYPDYFAAYFPICEAYYQQWLTDADIENIKNIPVWLVHCTTDPTVDYTQTSLPLYEKLTKAGAKNVHFTTYDKIVDPEYGNTYGGHFAWVYSLLNMPNADYDGSPVIVNGKQATLYEWVAAQSK